MGIRINTNMSSLMAQRQLGVNNSELRKTLERLSTGMRINRAGDDAAGLAVSEKMRTQIRGFSQAVTNAQDSINLLHTAESGIEQANAVIQRMRELAIQAANDSYTHTDRQKIQEEISQLRLELTRISQTTEFNTRKLLDGSLQSTRIGNAASAEIVTNVRVGNAFSQIPDIRNFIAGIQAMTTNVTVDSAIILKIVSTASPVSPNQIGMEVYSSVLGLLTTVNDISRLPSSSFGISLNSLTGPSGLLTLDLNKGGLLSGPVDRATSFANLMLVNRIGTVVAGNMSIDVGGTLFNIAVNPATDSINSVIAAINALSGGGFAFTASFNDVTSQFSVQVTRTQVSLLSDTDPPPGLPFPGPGIGPWGPLGAPLPGFPNPADPADISSALTFGGTSGLNNALFLPFSADTVDARVGVFTGFTTLLPGPTHTRTTNETHTQTSTTTATSTQPVGGSFQITADDIGKTAMIHVTAKQDAITVDNSLTMHVGANEGQYIKLGIDELSAKALRLEDITVVGDPIIYKNNPDTADFMQAEEAIGVIDKALGYVQALSARIGAMQNRLEYTISNLQVSHQSLSASESRIRDTDMAAETAALTRAQILVQAGTAILSQANVSPQTALSLLNGL